MVKVPRELTRVLATRQRWMSAERLLLVIGLLCGLVLVGYPVWALILEALRGSEGASTLPLLETLGDSRVQAAAWNTLVLAGGSALFAVIIGTGLAVIVARTNTPFAERLEVIGVLPLLTMPFVGAVAWTLLAAPHTGVINLFMRVVFGLEVESGPLNVYNMGGMIWVMGIFHSPYVFVLVTSALRSVDASMEEAARVSGAKSGNVLRLITTPLVFPAVLAGGVLVLGLSAGQFGVPAVIGGSARVEVLPTLIYGRAQRYPVDLGELTGIAVILLSLTATAIVIQRYALNRRVYATVGGKGNRAAPIDLGKWKYMTLLVVLMYLAAAVILPFLVLLYSSFIPFSMEGIHFDVFTLQHYQTVFVSSLTMRSLANSLVLAVSAGTLCVLLSLIVSYVVNRTRIRGRHLLQLISIAPLGIPSIILGVGVLAAWISPPVVLYGSMAILVVAYIGNFVPTGMQATTAGLLSVHRELEDAARTSGARWSTSARRVVLPLIRRSVVAAWLLVFVIMFRELGASVLLYTAGQEVVAVAILNLWEEGSYNQVAAFSTLVLFITFTIFAIVQRWSKVNI